MISIQTLKEERDALRAKLAETEAEQKVAEARLKEVRQREIQTKREIEALTVLIDLQESRVLAQAAPHRSDLPGNLPTGQLVVPGRLPGKWRLGGVTRLAGEILQNPYV